MRTRHNAVMTATNSAGATGSGGGRRATSAAHLSQVGLQLFYERGFDATTVDDIAEAAGIGRRTFFRYFASKNDLPWGDFDTLVDLMRARLSEMPEDVPLVEALRAAVIDFNAYPPDEADNHRRRMELLLHVPTLVAHSTLRYESWRTVVAEFAGRRLGEPADALAPQAIGWTFLAISLAAYESWLRTPGTSLERVLGQAIDDIASTMATYSPGSAG